MNGRNILFIMLLCILTTNTQKTTAQALKALMARQTGIIEGKAEQNSRKETCCNFYNNDWCDYYLCCRNDKAYNLHPGKNTLFVAPDKSKIYNPAKEEFQYRYYRGIFPKKFNIETPYALPVKNGVRTAWRTDRHETKKTLCFKIEKEDTVYATRGGILCKIPSSRFILIYHPDHTFAAYIGIRDKFVKPGDDVRTGQAIGIARQDNISISFFFLDKNKFEASADMGYPYSHFVPTFRTDRGDVRPVERKFYRVVTDDALIMQDMSKKEQKKYLKHK